MKYKREEKTCKNCKTGILKIYACVPIAKNEPNLTDSCYELRCDICNYSIMVNGSDYSYSRKYEKELTEIDKGCAVR